MNCPKTKCLSCSEEKLQHLNDELWKAGLFMYIYLIINTYTYLFNYNFDSLNFHTCICFYVILFIQGVRNWVFFYANIAATKKEKKNNRLNRILH